MISLYNIVSLKNDKVQMREIKMSFCAKGLPNHERLALLKLPTLHYRRIREDMIMYIS